MRQLVLTVLFATIPYVAYAENLFLDIPKVEKTEVIERNFEYFHKVSFDSLDGRSKLVRFNGDLFDETDSEISVMFFADISGFTVKNKGVRGNNKRSAYGYWTADIASESGSSSVDVRKGERGHEIKINVLLQYFDNETQEYRDAPGWYNVKKLMKSKGQEGFVGPVPADTKFVYRVLVSDILIHNESRGWTKYRIQSLPNNPEYVLISIPDQNKEFGIIEGEVDSVRMQRIAQYRQDYENYKKKQIEERQK